MANAGVQRGTLNALRPDLAEGFPTIENAAHNGFRFPLTVPRLPSVDVEVRGVLADGTRPALGRLSLRWHQSEDPVWAKPALPHFAGADESRASARCMVPILVEELAPTSVLDLGCGVGGWLAEFQAAGVEDVVGVDAGYVVDHLAIDRSRFVVADLTEPLDLGRAFDLVVSIEVAEHLPESGAETLISNIAKHGSLVFFSAASVGQSAVGHVNLQWPGYWAELFGRHGMIASDPFRRRFWNDERIAWWYRQNMLIFGTPRALARHGLEAEVPLAIGHPELVAHMQGVFGRRGVQEAGPG